MKPGPLDSIRDVLLNTRRGAYIAVAVVALVIALLLGISFSVAALIGTACGIIAQQIADERWISGRSPDHSPAEPVDCKDAL
jgi:hypothetical protein